MMEVAAREGYRCSSANWSNIMTHYLLAQLMPWLENIIVNDNSYKNKILVKNLFNILTFRNQINLIKSNLIFKLLYFSLGL
jgi:hypothetical protein